MIRGRAERIALRTLWWIVMIVFVLFFVVPVLWLVLAPSKSDRQLVFSNPLALGTWHNVESAWDLMFSYQSGALNNIPEELIDASSIDGANVFQVAWHVKLPLIKKWVFYMIILAFAAGTQLFVEPQLISEASSGLISPAWSPNELAYVFAFQNDNFNYAAAISLDLLVVGLVCAALLVARSGLFEID